MLKKFLDWLTGKPNVVENDKAVAEKLIAKNACGCGRSTVGHCVGLHKLSEDEWAVHPSNPNSIKVETAPAPVVETVAPVAETVAPVVETVAPVAEKIVVSEITVKPKVTAADLKGLNKKQLIVKATELNIPVNSRMTKDEISKRLLKS